MASLVIGPAGNPIPLTVYAPIIEIGPPDGSNWQVDPDLSMVSCGIFASSSKVSSCEFERRYGNTKYPLETFFTLRSARDMTGQWIRLSMVGDQGTQVQFVGVIADQSQELQGTAAHPGGKQNWIAYGGLYLLQKLDIFQSVFLDSDGNPSTVDWIPGMNLRDKRGLLVGNRSSDTDGDGNYGYGGTDTWSHLDFIKYLIGNFIQQGSGPTWTLTGQTDPLDQMKTSVKFQEVMSAAEMLRELIPIKYGLDFQVLPTSNGFAINVFALSASSQSFASVTMPSNPNTVSVTRDQQIDLVECRIVQTDAKRYDTIQVEGERIVVCGSLYGARVIDNDSPPADKPGDATNATCVPKWNPSLETEYISADDDVTQTPDDGPDIWDKIRKREKYREVYRHFGAPQDWDLDKGAWAVSCKDDGTVSTDEYQTTVRETLSWIPLKEGYDYSTDPPTQTSISDVEAVKPPMAFLYDESTNNGTSPRFVQAELEGIDVSHAYLDWGIMLDASPSHLVAFNHWTSDQLATTSLLEQRYDFDTLVTTVAIESDHRIRLSYRVPGNLAAGDGSVMTIQDAEAELWVLLANTVIDLDTDGTLIDSGGDQISLRDDTDRLALVMAGAISRYVNQRVRASLTIRGYAPWSQLLGSILTVVQQGDLVTQVGAPITSIEFAASEPMTIVKTGYA